MSGTLARDFVPCRKDDTLANGLYDLVNNKWYENGRTGSTTVEILAGSESPRSGLPANIIQLPYVDSNGAAIDTGLTKDNGYRLDAIARCSASTFDTTYAPVVFGGATFRLGTFLIYSTTAARWRAYNGGLVDAGAGSGYGIAPLALIRTRSYYNGKNCGLYADNRMAYTTTKATALTVDATEKMYLCAPTTTLQAGRDMRLYGVKIYTGATGFNDGTLARDYIPAYDTDAKKYGVYDCVNGVFSSSATEGTEFTGASHLMGSIKVTGSNGKNERLRA